MWQESAKIQHIELNREISLPGDVCFDPDDLSLHGFYADQLSAYRARKAWIETLENCFLLDEGHDFEIRVVSDLELGEFSIKCDFLSACARYAFWRLTNHQAPEAQYMIETAHIPNSESHQDAMIGAPDMKSILDEGFDPEDGQSDPQDGRFIGYLRAAINRLMP